MDNEALLPLTADIVSAHASHNGVAPEELPGLIQRVYDALAGLGEAAEVVAEDKVPVVSVRASIKPDYIVCMECGKKQKMLKRHLLTAHGMSPDQYRSDYGLPATYPMVAETYSERRRGLANAIGLGRNRGEKQNDAPAAEATETEAKPPRRRRKAAEAPSTAESD